MSRNQKPIGKVENGLFILDTKKHNQLLRGKTTSFQSEFQGWLNNIVNDFTKNHPEGYFLLFVENRKNEISLGYKIDLERYKTHDRYYLIPVNHWN